MRQLPLFNQNIETPPSFALSSSEVRHKQKITSAVVLEDNQEGLDREIQMSSVNNILCHVSVVS